MLRQPCSGTGGYVSDFAIASRSVVKRIEGPKFRGPLSRHEAIYAQVVAETAAQRLELAAGSVSPESMQEASALLAGRKEKPPSASMRGQPPLRTGGSIPVDLESSDEDPPEEEEEQRQPPLWTSEGEEEQKEEEQKRKYRRQGLPTRVLVGRLGDHFQNVSGTALMQFKVGRVLDYRKRAIRDADIASRAAVTYCRARQPLGGAPSGTVIAICT